VLLRQPQIPEGMNYDLTWRGVRINAVVLANKNKARRLFDDIIPGNQFIETRF